MTHVTRRHFLKLAGTGAAASAFAAGCNSPPSTVVVSPDRLAYVCGCKPDAHNPGGGGDAALFIGNYCKNSERFLLHWDLSAASPKRAITKAVLGLYCAEIYGTPSGRLVLGVVELLRTSAALRAAVGDLNRWADLDQRKGNTP